MRDFTLDTFKLLLSTLKDQQYTFQTFADFLKNPQSKAIILRHDVDARKLNSQRTAQIENEMGIEGTYNFRIVPLSYDKEIIREISALGHEIGYHYEDLSAVGKKRCDRRKVTKKDGIDGREGEELVYKLAIESFERNLQTLRKLVPVETICMHGSPLSRYDNKDLWKKYNYHDYGIIGEPYFDLDFSNILYLTDTGRRWDGGKVSVRDKVKIYKPYIASLHIHTTFNIIQALKEGILPDQMMINVHPQRWDDRTLSWMRELVIQNMKNVVKKWIVNK